jgi:hypothetical protein
MAVSSAPQDVEPSQRECEELLERLEESPQLRRSARLRELLSYVATRSLKEGSKRIHEHEVGVKVFGRPEGYDTNVDNIVRTNVTELRKRIHSYFETDGQGESLIVEIPRGSYVPVFRHRAAEMELAKIAEPALPAQPEYPPKSQTLQVPAVPAGSAAGRTLSGMLILGLALATLLLWRENRSLHRTLSPWRYSPALQSFWSGFLDNDKDTDVVLEDSAFLLVQNLDRRTFFVNDYMQRTFIGELGRQQLDPAMREDLDLIWGKKLDRASDVELAVNILALDHVSRSVHLYNARDYSSAPLARNNVILLGNPTANPWAQLFEDRLNFRETPNNSQMSVVTNNAPAAGERASYVSPPDTSYCAIAYLPKADHSGNMLLIQGATSEATKAGGDFLLSEERLSDFRYRLHSNKIPYFELLLKVSHVSAMPITSSIETYRVYPNLK